MQRIYDNFQHNGKTGKLIVHTTREEAGVGVEPSGFKFMNYSYSHTAFFHPYDGSIPSGVNPYKIRIGGKYIV